MSKPKIINYVLMAYKKTKLKPAQYCWVEGDKACALGALSCYKTKSKDTDILVSFASKCFGRDYVEGFIESFDTYNNSKHYQTKKSYLQDKCYHHNDSSAKKKGLWHGYLVAQRVFKS